MVKLLIILKVSLTNLIISLSMLDQLLNKQFLKYHPIRFVHVNTFIIDYPILIQSETSQAVVPQNILPAAVVVGNTLFHVQNDENSTMSKMHHFVWRTIRIPLTLHPHGLIMNLSITFVRKARNVACEKR